MLLIQALFLSFAGAQDAQLNLTRSVFETESPGQLVSLVDMTGDGRLELVSYTGSGVRIQQLDQQGRFAPEPLAEYEWNSPDVAWTLVDIDGDGKLELVTYEDASRCLVHRFDAEKELTHKTILEHKADIPGGVYRMDFLRDVNADGLQDIVLPQLGRFGIFLQTRAGKWSDPLLIQYETQVDLDVGSPLKLGSEFGQDIHVPWFDLRDVDGDGIQDLVSETSNTLRFHLGSPEISATPTWTLDLDELRAELPKDKGLDFDNLLGIAARGTDWKLADLDGQVPNELILRIGSKFRIYNGGSRTGASGSPSQVLKSSGNVLFFVLRNVLGDAAPELQIIRGEKFGLGQAIRWLVIPGSIDFDVFTYENINGKFGRRPIRRNQLTLGIPRILAFSERMEKMEEESERKSAIPAQRIALQPDAKRNDILDVEGNQLLIYLNTASLDERKNEELELSAEGALIGFLENHVDELGKSGSKSFDLADVEQWISFDGAELRAACAGKTPDHRIPLEAELSDVRIRTLDLNGNGRQDFIVLGHPRTSSSDESPSPIWQLHFFVH